MFIAMLFAIARTQKQPRCPSTVEWIKRLSYIYTMEYYSAIKRNKFESVVVRWMNLEPFIQSEVSQKEKSKYCILTHTHTHMYVESRKMVLINLFAGQEYRHRCRKWTWGHSRATRGGIN